jgi:hypothetical protein
MNETTTQAAAETVVLTQKPTNIPPIEFKRNSYGLLEHVNYKFDENGLVDYRDMIPRQYLVLNRQKEAEIQKVYGKTMDEAQKAFQAGEIEIEDKYLLILLAGIKYLSTLRGFSSVSYQLYPKQDGISAVCAINWVKNYETNNQEVFFSSMADATYDNTQSFAKLYLTATAENRAFVRAVRNFLRIHIVGQDEVGTGKFAESEEQTVTSAPTPHKILQDILDKKNSSFEIIKKKYITEGFEGAAEWKSITDIPKSTVLEIIGRINKKQQAN